MTKVGIAVFPGSNCDRDINHVLTNVLKVQTEMIWHTKENLYNYDAMIIPGGFSYGDRLRAGIIAAHSPIMKQVARLASDGMPVLGICNGFQILVESGLLPGALMMNDSLKFVCRWTTVRVCNNKTPYTHRFRTEQTFKIPLAHGEGRYVADHDAIRELKRNHQIVLQYHADNPNGSLDSIAAICNEQGNVMGIMPHPERASETILTPDGSNDAIEIFRSLVDYISIKQDSKEDGG